MSIDTRAPETVTAGDDFDVRCVGLDAEGLELPLPDDAGIIFFASPEERAERVDGDTFHVEQVGVVRVTCEASNLLLIDETAAEVTVEAGAAAYVETSLDVEALVAGEGEVTATCEAFDAFLNPVSAEGATLAVAPMGTEVLEGLSASFTQAGSYQLSCALAGAESSARPLTVFPNLPASLTLAVAPNDSVYAQGSVIELEATVTDAFGNPVTDATIAYGSAPAASQDVGLSRFRYLEDGQYTVSAEVTSATQDDVPLLATETVTINGDGPSIDCDTNRMLDRAIGSTFSFAGSVSDASGIASVTVNGAPATLGRGGAFSRNVTLAYGMNFFDVVATDSLGEENSRTCALLVSDHYVGQNSFVDDGVLLRLSQSAIDDNNRSGADNSLGDILHTAVNSSGIASAINGALAGMQLASGSQCIGVTIGGTCVGGRVRWDIEVRRVNWGGPHDIRLTLRNDGDIDLSATFRNVDVVIDIDGTVNQDVTAEVNSLSLTARLDPRLTNGQLGMRFIGSPNANASVDIDTSLPNWLDDIISDLARNQVEGAVEDAVEDAAADQINPLLDDLLSNLDINSLGTSFTLPRLGGGTMRLDLGIGLDTLRVNASRMIVGIGLRIRPRTVRVGISNLGVPVPSGDAYYDPGGSSRARVAVYAGVINQALHALWRGGFLEGDVGATVGGTLPAGANVQMAASLPPVATLGSNGTVRLGLGGLRVTVEIPGLFEGDSAIVAEVGAIARTSVSLSGNDLSFGNVSLDEFYFSTDGVSLDNATRDTIEALFRELMESVAASALNDALPALPIPSFPIPSNDFGLNGELGILSPSLTNNTTHFVLSGGFGLQ